jgi:hypothetical protein
MKAIYRSARKLSEVFLSFPLRLCVPAVMIFGCLFSINAQSTDQNFPTPVTSNEINGKIPARDIGDARLTTFYYVFNGNQGDVFINVVTANLDGDIDVFAASGLRPLTKIRLYSDVTDNETGRIIYLRQSEKLILRIEGRTPNDDPASFRIKFAGSFEPLKNVARTDEQNSPSVKTENEGEVRVNSVGTIIEVKPKATTPPVETKKEETETVAEAKKNNKKTETTKTEKTETRTDETAKEQGKSRKKTEKPAIVKEKDKTAEKSAEKKSEERAAAKNTAKTNKKSTRTEKTIEPNPLAGINLVVLFKDGTKIERPMSEVLRVNVDKGILTIIDKDGTVGRYSILDVTEMTIK